LPELWISYLIKNYRIVYKHLIKVTHTQSKKKTYMAPCYHKIKCKSFKWIPLDTTSRDKVCQWQATGRWFSPNTPVSSTNKTHHHDIDEILLKFALNTINLTITVFFWSFWNLFAFCWNISHSELPVLLNSVSLDLIDVSWKTDFVKTDRQSLYNVSPEVESLLYSDKDMIVHLMWVHSSNFLQFVRLYFIGPGLICTSPLNNIVIIIQNCDGLTFCFV